MFFDNFRNKVNEQKPNPQFHEFILFLEDPFRRQTIKIKIIKDLCLINFLVESCELPKIVCDYIYNSMKKVIPVETLYNIANKEQFSQFIDRFKKRDNSFQEDIIQQYYFIASNSKQAYLILAICYGNLTPQKLKEIFNNTSEVISNQQQILQKYDKFFSGLIFESQYNPIQTLKENINIFGKKEKFVTESIFTKISEATAQDLFKDCCSHSEYLYGTRIRELKDTDKIDRGNRRPFETKEDSNFSGNIYLVIDHVKPDYIIVGCFRTGEDNPTLHNRNSQESREQIQVQDIHISQKKIQSEIPPYTSTKNQVKIEEEQKSAKQSKCPFCQLI